MLFDANLLDRPDYDQALFKINGPDFLRIHAIVERTVEGIIVPAAHTVIEAGQNLFEENEKFPVFIV